MAGLLFVFQYLSSSQISIGLSVLALISGKTREYLAVENSVNLTAEIALNELRGLKSEFLNLLIALTFLLSIQATLLEKFNKMAPVTPTNFFKSIKEKLKVEK